MEGKINKDGNLEIKRAGKYLEQECLYENAHNKIGCGDWCPQFGEPETTANNLGKWTSLSICQDRLLEFDKFTDERGEDGKE